MRHIIIWFVVFSMGYFLGTYKTPEKQQNVESKDFVVKRDSFVVKIVESGILKAEKSTRIFSGLNNSAKLTYLVPEGTRVKKDDVIIRFDTNDVKNNIKNLEQKIQALEVKHETAKGDIEILEIESKNSISKAELTYQEAQKNLEKYLEGEFPLSKKEKEVKLEEAQVKLKRAKEKLEQMPELLEEGFVTSDRVEEEKINLKKAQVEYDTAESEQKLLLKYTKPLEVQKKKAEITKAKSELYSTKKQQQAKTKQKQIEIESAALEISNSQIELKKLQEELSKMVIVAPTDGLIIYGDPDNWWGRGDIKVGSEVSPHSVIVTLPDMTRMQVGMSVHEVEVRFLKKEMPCTITVESAGDMTTTGKINYIADLAKSSNSWIADSEIKEFVVEITLDGSNLGLKPGTTAKVEIVIGKRENVLSIPIEAVYAQGTQAFCRVWNNGWEERPIKLGTSNDEQVEVIEGLKEEEKILLGNIVD